MSYECSDEGIFVRHILIHMHQKTGNRTLEIAEKIASVTGP